MKKNFKYLLLVFILCISLVVLASCKEKEKGNISLFGDTQNFDFFGNNTNTNNNQNNTNTNQNNNNNTNTNTNNNQNNTNTNNNNNNTNNNDGPKENKYNEPIKYVKCPADEVGIYGVVVVLNDNAAEKGTIKLVYYGEKGSPQENTIIETLIVTYYTNTDGTIKHLYEYVGKYNLSRTEYEVKVVNTFGATTRASKVIISYAAEGEELVEIYTGLAEEHLVLTN